MKFAEFDQYSENMLMAQYDVSDIISHELMKGEIREDFLIATLQSCSEPNPNFVKGTLSDGNNDAGQLDIILCRPHSHLRRLGTQCLVSKDDALCVIEVKGNCTGTDLKKAAAKAVTILHLQGQTTPLYGVVCYKVALELKALMNRFGYSFDSANQTYFDNATIPNEAEKHPDLKIREILRVADEIQTHSAPIIQRCYSRFLVESNNPDDREYADATDQIREVLIHGNYLSQQDIEICIAFDVSEHKAHSNFPGIGSLHQSLQQQYASA